MNEFKFNSLLYYSRVVISTAADNLKVRRLLCVFDVSGYSFESGGVYHRAGKYCEIADVADFQLIANFQQAFLYLNSRVRSDYSLFNN